MGEDCRPGIEMGHKNCTYKLGLAFLHQRLTKKSVNVKMLKLGKSGGTSLTAI